MKSLSKLQFQGRLWKNPIEQWAKKKKMDPVECVCVTCKCFQRRWASIWGADCRRQFFVHINSKFKHNFAHNFARTKFFFYLIAFSFSVFVATKRGSFIIKSVERAIDQKVYGFVTFFQLNLYSKQSVSKLCAELCADCDRKCVGVQSIHSL